MKENEVEDSTVKDSKQMDIYASNQFVVASKSYFAVTSKYTLRCRNELFC